MNSAVIRFGAFELHPDVGELRLSGEIIRLERQPIDLLILLVRKRGEIVTRAEIVETLWGKDIFVESESGINTAISKVRRALGDDPANPAFIQTIVGKGYRFIAPMTPVETEATAEPQPVSIDTPRHRPRLLLLVVALAGIAAAAGAVFMYRRDRPKPIGSIAILPLLNLSRNGEEEFMVDGMTDQLITDLARLTPKRVISRTSVMQFKGAKRPVGEIARTLHVDAVLEGSMLHSGNRVRTTVQLIDARNDNHLWAESFDREQIDVLATQFQLADEIARKVASRLNATESAKVSKRIPAGGPAYELYLRGRYFWNKRTAEGIAKSVEYYNRALTADPNFALAYAGLADSLWLTPAGYLTPDERAVRAGAAARRALALDPTLGEPYATLGVIESIHKSSLTAAEAQFRKSISLSPGYATAHQWYSNSLSLSGRHAEAVAEARQGVTLDPLSLIINAQLGYAFYYARRYDDAIEQFRKTLELDAGFQPARYRMAASFEMKAMYADAISEMKKLGPALTEDSTFISVLAHIYARAGRRREAQDLLVRLGTLAKTRYVHPVDFAVIHAGLGEANLCIGYLEKAEALRGTMGVNADPFFDSIRSDPRFVKLVERVRQPASQTQP